MSRTLFAIFQRIALIYFMFAFRRLCWTHHCIFRFRKRLLELGKPSKGSSVMFRDSSGSFVNTRENVLIYYDGSVGSRALLNLVRGALTFHTENHESERLGNLPFPFTFTILYVYGNEA